MLAQAKDVKGMLIENLAQTDITAEQARLIAETFLLDHLGDQLTAGEPWPAQSAISRTWVAPILLTRSAYGPVGAVGVIVIDAATGQVIAATPKEIIQEQADNLLTIGPSLASGSYDLRHTVPGTAV